MKLRDESIKVKHFHSYLKVIPSPDDATSPHSLPNGANGHPDSESVFQPFQCRHPPPPHHHHPLCEIQMPSPSARRAPSRPNKCGGVVYHELLNVNLAEPAAMAAVCGGMSVITQTDKHQHTQKARQGSHCTITHKHVSF